MKYAFHTRCTEATKVALKYLGKLIGLLGAVCIIGAFTGLASSDSASVRLLHFLWVLVVGAALLAAGIWLVRGSKPRP